MTYTFTTVVKNYCENSDIADGTELSQYCQRFPKSILTTANSMLRDAIPKVMLLLDGTFHALTRNLRTSQSYNTTCVVVQRITSSQLCIPKLSATTAHELYCMEFKINSVFDKNIDQYLPACTCSCTCWAATVYTGCMEACYWLARVLQISTGSLPCSGGDDLTALYFSAASG